MTMVGAAVLRRSCGGCGGSNHRTLSALKSQSNYETAAVKMRRMRRSLQALEIISCGGRAADREWPPHTPYARAHAREARRGA